MFAITDGEEKVLTEREDTLPGFAGMLGTVVFQLRGLSTPGTTMLGNCEHPVQKNFEF